MKKQVTSPQSQTDWERVDALTDDQVDLTDCPEVTPEMFSRAVIRRGLMPTPRKAAILLHLDRDLVEWIKALGEEFQETINDFLRSQMAAGRP